MATRLWLPSAGAPLIAPEPVSFWQRTEGSDRIHMLRSRSNSASVNTAVSENVATNNLDCLIRQYISDPLSPQRLEGTVRAMVACMESSTSANLRAEFALQLVDKDGLNARTLVSFNTGPLASEWAGSLAGRRFPLAHPVGGELLTPADVSEGDCLVAEFGFRAHNTSKTNFTGTMQFGDPSTSLALAETETVQTGRVPWLEFSQDLKWLFDAKSQAAQVDGATLWLSLDTETGEVLSAQANPGGRACTFQIDGEVASERVSWASGDIADKLLTVPHKPRQIRLS